VWVWASVHPHARIVTVVLVRCTAGCQSCAPHAPTRAQDGAFEPLVHKRTAKGLRAGFTAFW